MSASVRVMAGGTLSSHLAAHREPDAQAGQACVEIDEGQSVAGLLGHLGLDPARALLIILNGKVVAADDRSSTRLVDGDTLSLAPPIRAG